MSLLNLPEKHIAEVSLIGTGGGYGESIVAHIGDNKWIVIDSCINPNTKECLPLWYLEQIGVDVSNDVVMVLCTHWHDDHILGISDLLNKASKASFCFAKALDKTKFLQLVSLDYLKLQKEASNSSTFEFNKCLEIIKTRKSRVLLAQENTTLLTNQVYPNIISQVISLSPSSQTILDFDSEISTLITEFGPVNKKIITNSPNSKSVALFLKLGPHRAILGADLEVGNKINEGWLNILNNQTVIDKKSSLYKVPHHGSNNGHNNNIWLNLLESNPISKLTPWNKNKKLPEPLMISTLCNLSSNVYMTSPTMNDKPKKRSKEIEKIINRLNIKLNELKFQMGIIKSRIDMTKTESNWTIELIDSAFHVNTQIQ